MPILANLHQLRDLMRTNDIAVYTYRYEYNNVNCFIAICLLTEDDKKLVSTKYALIRIRFMKTNNLGDYIDCYANSNKIDNNINEIRKFFNIPWNNDGFILWLNRFYEHFNNHIPHELFLMDDELQNVTIRTVCAHEGRDPNRIYRHHLLRHLKDENGKCKHRTEYNSQLAAWKFPHLYDNYRNDKTVSFAFTDNPAEEVSEEYALAQFIKIERRR